MKVFVTFNHEMKFKSDDEKIDPIRGAKWVVSAIITVWGIMSDIKLSELC